MRASVHVCVCATDCVSAYAVRAHGWILSFIPRECFSSVHLTNYDELTQWMKAEKRGNTENGCIHSPTRSLTYWFAGGGCVVLRANEWRCSNACENVLNYGVYSFFHSWFGCVFRSSWTIYVITRVRRSKCYGLCNIFILKWERSKKNPNWNNVY